MNVTQVCQNPQALRCLWARVSFLRAVTPRFGSWDIHSGGVILAMQTQQLQQQTVHCMHLRTCWHAAPDSSPWSRTGRVSHPRTQRPRRCRRASRAVVRAGLAETLTGVGLFFTPSLLALVYAYFKVKKVHVILIALRVALAVLCPSAAATPSRRCSLGYLQPGCGALRISQDLLQLYTCLILHPCQVGTHQRCDDTAGKLHCNQCAQKHVLRDVRPAYVHGGVGR